jgi:hypothetical protein
MAQIDITKQPTGMFVHALADAEPSAWRRRASTKSSTTSRTKGKPMRIRDIIADLIGIICIFGTGYAALLFGYGLGF